MTILRRISLPWFRLGLIASCAWAIGAEAQDVISGPAQWAGPSSQPDAMPTGSKLRPSYPRDARKNDEIACVMLRYNVSPDGKAMGHEIGASQPIFQHAVEEELQDWSMKPARSAGQPVFSSIFLPFIFNPRSASPSGPEATPRLLAVTPIYVPRKAFVGLGTSPIVRIRVSVDAAGKVTQVDFPFGSSGTEDAVRKALVQWQFAPARHLNQPTAATVVFSTPVQMRIAANVALVPAKLLKRVTPYYPMHMLWSRLRGEVTLNFAINELGVVEDVSVFDSNNPGFEDAAIEAVRQWHFAPATRNGSPIVSRQRITIHFEVDGPAGAAEGNDAYTMSGSGSNLPEGFRYDTAPTIRGTIQPVYPYELMTESAHGEATVAFIIGANGRVAGTRVLKSTRPEFGASLVAAVSTFRFDPALRKGKPTQTLSSFHQDFSSSMPMPSNASGNVYEDIALARDLVKHPERVIHGSHLDAPLHPISRRAGVFPPDLMTVAKDGAAVVRIIVDEDGHARLPRVISASAPAFGYAAVQAAQYWRFDPPKAGGKTVMTAVEVPFQFKFVTSG